MAVYVEVFESFAPEVFPLFLDEEGGDSTVHVADGVSFERMMEACRAVLPRHVLEQVRAAWVICPDMPHEVHADCVPMELRRAA